MKSLILMGLVVLAASCKGGKKVNVVPSEINVVPSESEDSQMESPDGSFRQFYRISHADIEARTVGIDENNPFRGLSKEYPEQMLKKAGVVFPEGVLLRYRWTDDTLIVSGPAKFHREIEKILKVKGQDPASSPKK